MFSPCSSIWERSKINITYSRELSATTVRALSRRPLSLVLPVIRNLSLLSYFVHSPKSFVVGMGSSKYALAPLLGMNIGYMIGSSRIQIGLDQGGNQLQSAIIGFWLSRQAHWFDLVWVKARVISYAWATPTARRTSREATLSLNHWLPRSYNISLNIRDSRYFAVLYHRPRIRVSEP